MKDERIFEDAKDRDITRLGLNDLLIQQFSMYSYAYSSGLFVKSVDLFVSAKDATLIDGTNWIYLQMVIRRFI